jgi:tetratricopeptide (TPR) repeat protein
MLVAMTVVLAQTTGWSGGRPPECVSTLAGAGNVWERAKSPEIRRYCDRIASASSKLAGSATMAQAALAAAREASGVLPGRAAPRVLEGRALAALGQFDLAIAALDDARSRDPRSLDDPLALLAYARSQARTGHAEKAAEAYRALLPRASALAGAERSRAATEAGLVALARGPHWLDDAMAAFRESLRQSQDDSAPVATLGLALALDRGAEPDGSRALLVDRDLGDARAALSTATAKELCAVAPNECNAMLALGLETADPVAARAAWQVYIAGGPEAPWVAHARAHTMGSLPRPGGRGASRRAPR